MGSMGVQEDGKEAMTLKPGDTLLIKQGPCTGIGI
jgi:hypothetical protein